MRISLVHTLTPGDSERIHLQCRRPEFDPWIRNISWKREWLPSPVSLPGEFHQQEPGVLQSMGSQRVGQDWATNPFTYWKAYLDLCVFSVMWKSQRFFPFHQINFEVFFFFFFNDAEWFAFTIYFVWNSCDCLKGFLFMIFLNFALSNFVLGMAATY